MPTYFIITELEGSWTWQDFLVEGMEYEYCTTALDIPEEAIEYIEVFDDSMEIQLFDDAEFANEDWYIQLVNLSSVSDVSA
ncbi:MAG: hypothetical protein KU28_01675 [Sulfurovum sp. PC08-66]|nr:MAG: hypothetical protein KU28_01675 [Sulfurovum sp. PC08-66]KIM12646.1 MAG: hypothetical protein KU37_01780 [Sulfuricurvum sp. PC08-66]